MGISVQDARGASLQNCWGTVLKKIEGKGEMPVQISHCQKYGHTYKVHSSCSVLPEWHKNVPFSLAQIHNLIVLHFYSYNGPWFYSYNGPLKEDRVLPNTMRLYISCYPPQNRAVFRTLCLVTYIHKPVLHLSVLNHLLPTRVKKNSLPFPSVFPFFIFLFWFLSFWLPRFVFFFLPPQY